MTEFPHKLNQHLLTPVLLSGTMLGTKRRKAMQKCSGDRGPRRCESVVSEQRQQNISGCPGRPGEPVKLCLRVSERVSGRGEHLNQ